MAKVKYCFIHHSDSSWGTAMEINKWHQQRGWKEIGYSFVITNGKPTAQHYKQLKYESMLDGQIEIGRELNPDGVLKDGEIGAHVKNFNSVSIGICLIGRKSFTIKQYYSLIYLLNTYIIPHFGIPVNNILGHYETDKNKTCPNIDMNNFRTILADDVKLKRLLRINDWARDKVNSRFIKILDNYTLLR